MILNTYRGLSVPNWGEEESKWVYGSLWKVERNGKDLYRIYSEKHGEWVRISNETVGQCVGLEYGNEQLAYCGDVFRPASTSNLQFLICYGFYKCNERLGVGFYLKPADDYTKQNIDKGLRTDIAFWISSSDKSILVGNIHDNPELLTISK